jgi:hypothetical protein
MAKDKDWDARSSSLGICHYAKTYLDAAIILHEHNKKKLSGPLYYLVCHSIELALKAFLKANGITIVKSKNKFGHDLGELLNEVIKFDLFRLERVDCDLFCLMVLQANFYYKEKEFEYLYSGYKKYPEIGPLISGAKELIDVVYIACRLDYERTRREPKD